MNSAVWKLSTAAITLALATGMASAQNASPGGMKGGEAPAASAPASSGGAAKGSMGTEHSAPSGGNAVNEKGMSNAPRQAQENRANPAAKSQAQSSEGRTSGEMKGNAEMKGGAKSNESAQGQMKGEKGSTAAETRSNANGNKTTGNAATSATAAPPAEKRSQISSAIKQEKVKEVTNVNFNISVGARVPASVHYYPLPARIVEIYPEWRGYDFILVNGRYIILRPETHEIVYIIES